MHMGSLVIVNLIWSLMSQLGDSQTIYHCKTKEELDEYRNGLMHRLLIHKNTVYLVLKSRIVSFRAPYTEADRCGEVHLVSSLPFAYEHKEQEISKKIIGYLVVDDSTYELYKSKVANRFIGYRLDFESVLADKKESNYLYLNAKEVDDSVRFLFVYQVNNLYALMFVYGNYTMNFYYFQVPANSYDFKEPPVIRRTVDQLYRVRYAVFYRFQKKSDNEDEKKGNAEKHASQNVYFLIELDDDQHLHVRQVSLPYPQRQNMEVKFHKVISIKLSHLLSCHQPFESPSEVKGVYHDPENELFFVFVDRFYFETHDNLVKSGFNLSPKYFDQASDLTFDKNLKHTLEFRNSATKWIKTLRYQSFLVTADRAFPVESPTIKNGFFEFKNDYVTAKLTQCEGQTLEIGDVIFCFDQKTYTSMETHPDPNKRPKRYNIEQIFANTRIDYTNQTLEMIFNYNDAFVLMTRSFLYVVNYALANLESDRMSIAISDGPKDRLYRLKNRLFHRIPSHRLSIQPVEKALFILILILINLVFTGVIFRVIVDRKRLAENRSQEMLNFIYKTMSLRDNIRKTLNVRDRSRSSQRSNRSGKSSRSRGSSKSKKSGRSGKWMKFNLMRESAGSERPNDHTYWRDRKKEMTY